MVYLIKCRACGKETSSEASVIRPCRHCGDAYVTEEYKKEHEQRMAKYEEERQRQEKERLLKEKQRSKWIDAGLCGRCGAEREMEFTRAGPRYYCTRRCW